MAPFSKSSTPQSGLFSKMMGLADWAMKAAPMTLVSEMTAPCERSMPAMMSTNVCPMATTKSGHMLESRLVMLYGRGDPGDDQVEDREQRDAEVQDEVLGHQDAPAQRAQAHAERGLLGERRHRCGPSASIGPWLVHGGSSPW